MRRITNEISLIFARSKSEGYEVPPGRIWAQGRDGYANLEALGLLLEYFTADEGTKTASEATQG